MQKAKRSLGALLSVCMVLAMLPALTMTASAANVWDGTRAAAFAGGDGSKANPDQIATGAQLAYLADVIASPFAYTDYRTKYYKLTDNIDLDSKLWSSIGLTEGYNFRGVFDGNGKTISGLRSATDNHGLFGYILNGEVKNLTVSGAAKNGGIAYYLDNSIIDNCHFSGTVTGSDANRHNAGRAAGGIVGQAVISSTVSGCTSSATVSHGTSYVDYIGGIVGYLHSSSTAAAHGYLSTVSDCVNTGAVTGPLSVGGIAGGLHDAAVIDSANTGKVTLTYDYYSGMNFGNLGGLVGEATKINSGCYIQRSYNTGDVTSSWSSFSSSGSIGGILGVGGSRINDCYNTGNVSVTITSGAKDNFVGGIIGYSDDGYTVNYCYNTGDVTTACTTSKMYVAGIAGTLYSTTLSSCVSLGKIVTVSGVSGGRYGRIAGGVAYPQRVTGNKAVAVQRTGGPGRETPVEEQYAGDETQGSSIALGTPLSSVFSGWSAYNWTIPSGTLTGGGALPTLKKAVQQPGPVTPSYPGPISAGMFTVDTSDEVYTAAAITKTITSSLVLDMDYSVTYKDNVNIGTATITITGKGSYSGTLTYTFKITKLPRTITAEDMILVLSGGSTGTVKILSDNSTDSRAYTYASSNPQVASVPWNEGVVTPVAVGTATITVTAMESAHYQGATTTLTVTVRAKEDASGAMTFVDAAKKTYSKSASYTLGQQFSQAACTLDGGAITYSYDGKAYDSLDVLTAVVRDAGAYTVTAIFENNTHYGTKDATFVIEAASLTNAAAITTAEDSYTYTGEAVVPAITVKLDGDTLTAETDYTLEITDNINTGTATITVTGKGNYTGTASEGFTIDPAPITAVPEISGDNTVGSVLTAALSGMDPTQFTWQWLRGGEVIDGADSVAYTLSPADSNKAITVRAKAVQGGNYTGDSEVSEAVNVEKMAISGTVTLSLAKSDAPEAAAGVIENGDTLTAILSGILPKEAQGGSFTYQWIQGGEEVGDKIDYVVADGEEGDEITVTVTAQGDFTGAVSSVPVAVDKKLLLLDLVIQGDSTLGSEITFEKPQGLTGDDVDYIWMRDDEQICPADEDEPAYTVVKADLGKSIYLKATGKGEFSGESISNLIVIPAIAPEAPAVSATGGNAQITVTWTAPFSGGAPITGYLVQLGEDAPVLMSPQQTSHTFTGLTNGQSYTVTVIASNSVGNSEAGAATAMPKAPAVDPGPGDPDPTPGGATTPTKPVTETVKDTTITTSGGQTVVKNKDGSLSLPSGGTVSVGSDVKVTAPGGTIIDTDGTVTIPDNKQAQLTLTGSKAAATVPGGTVVSADGTVTVGNGTATVTLPGKAEMTLSAGSAISGDTVTVGPGGATVTVNGETYSYDEGEVLILDEDVPLGFYAEFANPFDDVKEGDWYYEAVKYVYQKGIMQGTGKGFEPQLNLNRAMLVQMLYNLVGRPEAGAASFADVAADAWYADAIAWAAGNGIVNGVGNNRFAPTGDITREQMAVMLYNYCQFKGIELPTVRETGEFADSGSVNSWAQAAVDAMYKAGVLNGKGDGVFDPQGKATRAEVAQMFLNFMEAIG